MILTKGFRTQSSLCRSQSGSLIHIQSGSNWQKLLCNSVPKHCIFAAVKVPTAVTLAMYCVCSPNDRLYFHQIIQTKVFLTQDGVLASEKGSPDHKSGLDWYQKEPQTPCFFFSDGGSNSCYSGNKPAFRAHNSVSGSHGGFPTTKVAEYCQKCQQ